MATSGPLSEETPLCPLRQISKNDDNDCLTENGKNRRIDELQGGSDSKVPNWNWKTMVGNYNGENIGIAMIANSS